MGAFGEPAPANYTPPNGLTTLNDLMSLKTKKQQLESQALTIQGQQQGLQGQAAQVQQEQQTAGQRAGIANFMASFDPSKHVGSDGTLNLDEVLTDPKLRQAAGDQFPQIMQQMIQAKQGQLTAKQQLANLNDSLRNQFSSTVGSLRTDPDVVHDNEQGRAKVKQALQNFGASGGDDAARVSGIYGQVIDHVPPKKLAQTLSNFQLQAMDASTQAGRQAPVLTDTGATIQNVNPQAAGGNITGTPPINKTIAPGAVPVTDANNRSFILNPATNRVNPMGAGNGSGPAAPGAPQFVQPTADAATVQKNIASARDAGDQAPLNQHINDQLIRLSNDTATGYGTQKWHEAVGALSGGKFGSDYQTIGAYLDRQAAMSSRSMGLPDTNAGLAASQSLSGHTGYAKDALQTKVKLADTLNTAAQQYRQGLDRVVGVGTNQDNSKYEAYRSAWAKNFDPQVFAAENALRRGDKAELEKIQKEEGPRGMQELAAKTQALRALANGQLPQ